MWFFKECFFSSYEVMKESKLCLGQIRCYPDTEETVKFAQRLEATGISALAIHGRLKVFNSFAFFLSRTRHIDSS